MTQKPLPSRSVARAARALRRSSGFTLIELIVVVAIGAMLAAIMAAQVAAASEESIAQGGGSYIAQVAAAAEQYALTNYEALSKAEDVPSALDDLRPTIPELVAARLLNAGFPSGAGSMPTRQDVRIDVLKQNCPGANCMLQTLVCTTTPISLGGAYVKYNLAQVMVDQMHGIGGQALQNSGGTIRGPVLNTPNPMGNVPGIVCGSATVNQSLFQQFVRVRDTRDPQLQGNLTVEGAVTLNGPTTINNNLAVEGDVDANSVNVNNCVRLQPNGRGGFNCLNPDDVPAGMAGGVRAVDVIANANVVTTDLGSGFTGNNGNFAIMTSSAGGEAAVVTSGRMAGNRIIPTGSYAPGTACADPGAVALSAAAGNGSWVLCTSGVWTPMSTVATAGGACSVEGQGASDPAGRTLYCFKGQWTRMSDFLPAATDGGACVVAPGTLGYDGPPGAKNAFLCRLNPATNASRWNRLQDITTNMVFVTSVEVQHGSVVAKPSCLNGAGPAPSAVPQLIPKAESSGDGGFTRFVVDNGGSWTVQLLNGSGTPLAGTAGATAVLTIFCYYP